MVAQQRERRVLGDRAATVQLIGRDQVLRFEIGNWIEITDDFRELQGLAGHMAQITAIDEANRILTFAPAIPGAIAFNPADPDRHTRVRRWDQSQNVDANGLLDVTAGAIDIEDGIRVTFAFDPPAGGFKIGDYWAFAARTVDGSVEDLQSAPPRGILHHYCRLGFIHWGADLAHTTFTDCREHWPPLCCEAGCTVTVGDGVDSHGQFTDIQQAINALGNRGGVVCIGRGFYTVTSTLRVDGLRNVIIRGMGPATRIFFAPQQGSAPVFLSISGAEHIRFEDVFVAAVNVDALVRITASHFCRVEKCILVNLPAAAGRAASQSRAVDLIENPSHCEIVHNLMVAGKGVACSVGNVSELSVRDNQMLCTQIAVMLREARGVEIVHNQLRGLGARPFPGELRLSRDTIDEFQVEVSAAFRAAAQTASFQAAGVLVYAGNRVVVSENLISAQIAVLGFLLIDVRVERNDVLSLIGVLLIFGAVVKVEDNFVLGIFAGLIHAGIVADLDCTSNEWVGLVGIVWMSLEELLRSLGPLLGGALGSLGIAGPGPNVVGGIANTGAGLAGNLLAFGLVLIAKVHRNVFLTFLNGIYKTDGVASADVAVVDNTFSLCFQSGIELGGGTLPYKVLSMLGPLISLRHLVQSNALAVQGKGIVSSTVETFIEQNQIQCSATGVELDAFGTIRNNLVFGLAVDAHLDTGLIVLHERARDATIAGNQLADAPGHSILIVDGVRDLTIDDNLIVGARGAGIATRTDAVFLRGAHIRRNRVRECRGAFAPESFLFGGAVAIGEAADVRFSDNTITDNSPERGTDVRGWFAVFFADVAGLEFRANAVNENATGQGLAGFVGAVGLAGVRGAVQVQNNVVRGNGGVALQVSSAGKIGEDAGRMQVQSNHFSSGPNPPLAFVSVVDVDWLSFEGNQCFWAQEVPLGIFLVALRANVCGNTAEKTGAGRMSVSGAELVVNGNSVRSDGNVALTVSAFSFGSALGRAIVTSNLTTGLVATATNALIRIHNIPPP
jgi:Family of unknown function (DUF6519)/Right handed beta helix region